MSDEVRTVTIKGKEYVVCPGCGQPVTRLRNGKCWECGDGKKPPKKVECRLDDVYGDWE